MAFYAYLLCCNDGGYYAGLTDDIDLRMAQNQSGVFGGYTPKRLPVTLVWNERKLKGGSQAKKEAPITGDWELVAQLARNRQN